MWRKHHSGQLSGAPHGRLNYRHMPSLGRVTLTLSTCMLGITGCTSTPEQPPATESQVAADSWVDLMVKCLNDAGWPVEKSEQGDSYGMEILEDQNDLYQAADSKCRDQIGVEVAPPSGQQLDHLYEIRTTAAECMTALGMNIAIPSKQEFASTIGTESEWHPFSGLTEDELSLAFDKCYLDGL